MNGKLKKRVYIDRVQVSEAMNGSDDWNLDVAEQIAREHDFCWVLSHAHFEDLSHSDPSMRAKNMMFTNTWPCSKTILVGWPLFRWEHLLLLHKLVGNDCVEWNDPVVDEEKADELIKQLGFESDTPNRCISDQGDSLFTELRLQKDQLALAKHYKKIASFKGKKQDSKIVDELACGRIPELVAQIDWDKARTEIKAEPEEALFLPNKMSEILKRVKDVSGESNNQPEEILALMTPETVLWCAKLLSNINHLKLPMDELEFYSLWRAAMPDNPVYKDKTGNEFSVFDDEKRHRAFFQLAQKRPDLTPGFFVYCTVRDVNSHVNRPEIRA